MGTQPIACADCRAREEETSGGMILCSYHFGHECKPWCGQPCGDHAYATVPFLGGPNDIAYCTAACLERAKANQPPAPVKRELVAPWRLFESLGCASCSMFLACDRATWTVAWYVRPASPSSSHFACEACAERAGVFGPVSAKTTGGHDANENSKASISSAGERSLGEPASTGVAEGARGEVHAATEQRQVTCSGPLSTHGTPVLRVVGKPRWWDADDGKSNRKMLCDACYLAAERDVAESTSDDASWLADGVQSEPYTEPPARIGTVPMSIGPGAGIGIWASRGMRK